MARYTDELYKKELHDPDNHNGVIIHLEPDILECEVKWALGSIMTNKVKRWQGYTEELYKKYLHGPDNHHGVITALEPDILECEVKWALGSIIMNKASGGDGIPAEMFQILKDE